MMACLQAKLLTAGDWFGRTPMPRLPLPFTSGLTRINFKPLGYMFWNVKMVS
jgi:hypothetical protein